MRLKAMGVACIVAAVALTACGGGSTGTGVKSKPTVPRGLVGRKLSAVEDKLSGDPIQYVIAGASGYSFVPVTGESALPHLRSGSRSTGRSS